MFFQHPVCGRVLFFYLIWWYDGEKHTGDKMMSFLQSLIEQFFRTLLLFLIALCGILTGCLLRNRGTRKIRNKDKEFKQICQLYNKNRDENEYDELRIFIINSLPKNESEMEKALEKKMNKISRDKEFHDITVMSAVSILLPIIFLVISVPKLIYPSCPDIVTGVAGIILIISGIVLGNALKRSDNYNKIIYVLNDIMEDMK